MVIKLKADSKDGAMLSCILFCFELIFILI
jgi:hypothetical protein